MTLEEGAGTDGAGEGASADPAALETGADLDVVPPTLGSVVTPADAAGARRGTRPSEMSIMAFIFSTTTFALGLGLLPAALLESYEFWQTYMKTMQFCGSFGKTVLKPYRFNTVLPKLY